MRSLSEQPGAWEFGPFRLDPANQRLWREEEEALALRPKAFSVLCHLVERAGQLVSKDELLAAVWPRGYVSESALEGCVNQLRKALGDDRQAPRYIETVAKRGYRFVAEVRALSGRDAPGPDAIWPGLASAANAAHWVGRQDLVERLRGFWRHAQDGQRQLVFLSGEAGLGKTTLIEMFLRRVAPERPAVLFGQCIDHIGAGEAFLPLLDALSRAGTAHSVRAALRAKAPAWLIQLPGLLGAEQRLELQPEVLGATRERMLREGCELLEALSVHTPLLLIFEDLHWSDGATLDLLAWLGRRREAAKLMVIGSYRPSDLAWRDHPLQRVRQELQSHRLCVELPLDAFTPAELDAYLANRFPDSRFPEDIARILYRRSSGHPLFLVNLLDYLLAEGRLKPSGGWWSVAGGAEDLGRGVPDDLRVLIERQITRLAPEQQRLLEVLSAVGMEGSAALLAAVLDEDPLAVESRCDILARRGPMLEVAGEAEWPDGTVAGNYAFCHALYGEVLYERLSPAYRIALHRQLGERLEAAFLDQTGEIAAELARHFEAGRDWPKAVQYLRQAAQQSAGRFANREALGYLGRALELVERLTEENRVDERLWLLQQRALIHRALSDWRNVTVDLEALVTLARRENRQEQEIGGMVLLSVALLMSDRSALVSTLNEAVERGVDLEDGWVKIFARQFSVYCRLEFDRWQTEDRASILRGVENARQARDRQSLPGCLGQKAIVFLYESRYREALTLAQEMAQLSLGLGDAFTYMAGKYFAGWALLYLGVWNELQGLLSVGTKAAEQNLSLQEHSKFLLVGAAFRLEALDFQGALAFCERANPKPDDPYVLPLYLVLSGHAHLGLRRYDDAENCFGRFSTALENGALIERRFRLLFRRGYAEYWLSQQDLGRARSEAEKLLELACPPGERACLALGHRLLAQIALAEQNWDEAQAHVDEALGVIEGAEVPLAAWRVYEIAAELHQRLGHPAEALRFSEQAADILRGLADSLGDDPEAQGLRQSLLGHRLLQGALPRGQERGRR